MFPLGAKARGYITVHVARASAGVLTILWDDLTAAEAQLQAP